MGKVTHHIVSQDGEGGFTKREVGKREFQATINKELESKVPRREGEDYSEWHKRGIAELSEST